MNTSIDQSEKFFSVNNRGYVNNVRLFLKVQFSLWVKNWSKDASQYSDYLRFRSHRV